MVSDVKLIKGFDTNTRRQQLGLEKGSKKEERDPSSHVNDCIAMGSIIPKYSRRKLHNEQPSKGGIRRRFGGITTDWTNIRKGDYVEAVRNKQSGEDILYRGWVGGFENVKKFISVYDFDWKVIGQFDSKKVRLLNRNNGLMIKSLEIEENRINICKYGTEQLGIDNAW